MGAWGKADILLPPMLKGSWRMENGIGGKNLAMLEPRECGKKSQGFTWTYGEGQDGKEKIIWEPQYQTRLNTVIVKDQKWKKEKKCTHTENATG